jgi:hypothetical protein
MFNSVVIGQWDRASERTKWCRGLLKQQVLFKEKQANSGEINGQNPHTASTSSYIFNSN